MRIFKFLLILVLPSIIFAGSPQSSGSGTVIQEQEEWEISPADCVRLLQTMDRSRIEEIMSLFTEEQIERIITLCDNTSNAIKTLPSTPFNDLVSLLVWFDEAEDEDIDLAFPIKEDQWFLMKLVASIVIESAEILGSPEDIRKAKLEAEEFLDEELDAIFFDEGGDLYSEESTDDGEDIFCFSSPIPGYSIVPATNFPDKKAKILLCKKSKDQKKKRRKRTALILGGIVLGIIVVGVVVVTCGGASVPLAGLATAGGAAAAAKKNDPSNPGDCGGSTPLSPSTQSPKPKKNGSNPVAASQASNPTNNSGSSLPLDKGSCDFSPNDRPPEPNLHYSYSAQIADYNPYLEPSLDLPPPTPWTHPQYIAMMEKSDRKIPQSRAPPAVENLPSPSPASLPFSGEESFQNNFPIPSGSGNESNSRKKNKSKEIVATTAHVAIDAAREFGGVVASGADEAARVGKFFSDLADKDGVGDEDGLGQDIPTFRDRWERKIDAAHGKVDAALDIPEDKQYDVVAQAERREFFDENFTVAIIPPPNIPVLGGKCPKGSNLPKGRPQGGSNLPKGSNVPKPQPRNMVVYQSVGESGEINYVGITKNFDRRSAEHLRQRGIFIEPIPGLSNLTLAEARAVEQTLIELHGLGKNGGTLDNRINSIGKTNPKYAAQLEKGRAILAEKGYPGVE